MTNLHSKPESRIPKPETPNPKLSARMQILAGQESRNLKPETRNLKPQNPEPHTQNPEPHIPNPRPGIRLCPGRTGGRRRPSVQGVPGACWWPYRFRSVVNSRFPLERFTSWFSALRCWQGRLGSRRRSNSAASASCWITLRSRPVTRQIVFQILACDGAIS